MSEAKKLTVRATSQIDIRSLKAMIFDFPNSALRDLILTEADLLTRDNFVLKMEIWLKLLRRIHL